ncbi:MAG: Rrf2 family transcriptional regulator [Actinomycetes bacterium]
MRISARADYAVRAAIELAAVHPDIVKTEAIATQQSIPVKFLEAIMSDLRRAGLVRSKRGADGGYQLMHEPSQITVADVIRAVDGPLAWVRDQRPGAVRYTGSSAALEEVWVAVRASLRAVLDHVSLADVVAAELPAAVTDLTSDPAAWSDPR